MSEMKSEIRARIDELESMLNLLYELSDDNRLRMLNIIQSKIDKLKKSESEAQEDLFRSVIRSHEVICAVKEMDEKAAYGQNAAMYYSLAIAGEVGEMANKIVRSLKNGDNIVELREAVVSELPDVIVYSAVLAHVMDIDLTKEVNDKVKIVINRALNGYYGGPIRKD
jgi:NTP pyrophosphatase (non-canonical NTP hydrolase)